MSEQKFISDKNLANVNLEHGNVNIYMTENVVIKAPDTQPYTLLICTSKKLTNISLRRRRCFLLTSHILFTSFMSAIIFHIIMKHKFQVFKTAKLKKQLKRRHLRFLKRNQSI